MDDEVEGRFGEDGGLREGLARGVRREGGLEGEEPEPDLRGGEAGVGEPVWGDAEARGGSGVVEEETSFWFGFLVFVLSKMGGFLGKEREGALPIRVKGARFGAVIVGVGDLLRG